MDYPKEFLESLADAIPLTPQTLGISWEPDTWLPLSKIVLQLVVKTEQIANSSTRVSGSEKEAVVQKYLDEKVKLPLLNKDMKIEIVQLLIVLIVQTLNCTLGRQWVVNMPEKLWLDGNQ